MMQSMVSGATVLIVDDDDTLRETLGMILQDEGYTVDMAANGQEALTHLRSAPAPCLILLDLMMPVMSGWEFRVRQRQDPALASIPVVVVSAVANNVERMDALEATAYFRKPVDLDALLAMVASHCR
jgi:CheY-like chemotaxis protein